MRKLFVFIGPPASGKDTQAELLAERNSSIEVFSPGQLLRREAETGSQWADNIRQASEQGLLVDNHIVDSVIRKELGRADLKDTIIFTGFPRNMGQLPMLDALLTDLDFNFGGAVYFELSDEIATERITGRWYAPESGETYHTKYNPPKVEGFCDISGEQLVRRADDEPEVVAERLEVFRERTLPVVDEFRRRGQLIEINAAPSIEDVYSKVVDIIK